MAVVVPLAIDTNAKYFLYSRMSIIAIVVVSVTILTGWAGQLSLAQFALAGPGRHDHGRRRPPPQPAVPARAGALAIAVCVVAAVIMGIPSFRVRGMYLAIVTLAFANAAYAWLFHQRIFNGGRDAARYEPDPPAHRLARPQRPPHLLPRRAWRSLVVVVLMANRLRRSGVGRALVAVRDNEASAAAFTIAPRATKLSAFALAGGLAGFAGALLMALLTNARADQFPVDMSLSAVSMAVIGGLASAAGAVIGTLWVVGLPGHLRQQPDGRPAHLRRRAARADHVLPRRPGAGGLRHPREPSFGRSSGGSPQPPLGPRWSGCPPRPGRARAIDADAPPAGRAEPGGARASA